MFTSRILAFICLASASASAQEWTNLRVHYSLNPFSDYYYQIQPRGLYEDSANDYTSVSDGDCTNGGKYNGFRHIKNGESGMALLFDIQGTIAGIQQILNKAQVEANNDFQFGEVPSYNPDTLNGEEVYVITAYFVDPEIICTIGRSSEDLANQGTGSLIQLQNGPTPSQLLVLPRQRDEAIRQGWSENMCFVGMGYHNFYKVEEMAQTNCDQVVPLFGLYDNNGYQIGFGFSATGADKGNYFEYPPSGAVEAIVGEGVPQCLLDNADSPGLTTMHVFFTDFPYTYACIL